MKSGKRVNRIFLILGVFVFGILISLILFNDILYTKLEKPTFTSFYVVKNPTVPEQEIYPLDLIESKSLILGLRFSAWKVTQRNKSIPFSFSFVLYDDKGTTYSFGQDAERMLIQVRKKGSKWIVFYDTLLNSDEVLNRVLVPLNSSETGKAQLKKASFLSANIGPDYSKDLFAFGLNSADAEKMKANMQWADWKMINHLLDDLIVYDFVINLDTNKLLKFGKFEKHFYASIHTTIDGVETTNISYDIPQKIYDDMLATLADYRLKYFGGLSKLVSEAVFNNAYIWVEGGKGMYPGWKFPITKTESDNLKTLMKSWQLLRLNKRVELSWRTMCLFDTQGYQYCFVGSDNMSYLVVESISDTDFYETYYILSLSSEFGQALSSYWGTPIIPNEIKTFNFTQTEIINSWSEEGESDIDIYNVTTSQRTRIRTILRFDDWVFDKDSMKYHFGWYNKYAFKTKDGSTIRVFDFRDTTVFWVQNLIPGIAGDDGAWFYTDKSVYEHLEAYMTATFPKK